MNENDINDKRTQKEFSGITFSQFKKSDVKRQLINSILYNKIEEACYWSAEFICSGHFIDLWEIIILLIGKHIHIGNPKISIYLELRLNFFRDMLNNGYIDNEIKMRNNQKIREMFAEIVCVLCLSRKKNSFDVPKIPVEEYNILRISYKLEADSLEYGQSSVHKEDPKELFIAVNELAYNLSSNVKNMTKCIYWIEWILGFEALSKRENKLVFYGTRRAYNVANQFQKDIVWIIWDLILKKAKEKSKGMYKIVSAINSLFCLKYLPGVKKKRKYLMFYSIALLTEYVDNSVKIINNSELIEKIKKKINVIYKQIKVNEITPKTDYLFNNSYNSGNLEKTIERLEKMNSLTNLIPRS
jgi:hypothetical protein